MLNVNDVLKYSVEGENNGTARHHYSKKKTPKNCLGKTLY